MAGGKIKRRKNIVDELSSRIIKLIDQVLSPGRSHIACFLCVGYLGAVFLSLLHILEFCAQ